MLNHVYVVVIYNFYLNILLFWRLARFFIRFCQYIIIFSLTLLFLSVYWQSRTRWAHRIPGLKFEQDNQHPQFTNHKLFLLPNRHTFNKPSNFLRTCCKIYIGGNYYRSEHCCTNYWNLFNFTNEVKRAHLSLKLVLLYCVFILRLNQKGILF